MRDVEAALAALDEGDFETAHAALARAKRVDRKHPEVLSIEATLASIDGDIDRAMELWEEVVTALPDAAGPRVAAATLAFDAFGDPARALQLLAPALELIDDEEELHHAIIIKTSAHLALADSHAERGHEAAAESERGQARAALAELASSVLDDTDTLLEFAVLAIDARDFARATAWIDQAQQAPEAWGDAEMARALLAEAQQDAPAVLAAWQRVRKWDDENPPESLEIAEDAIDDAVRETLAELPAPAQRHLNNVAILLEDAPAAELLGDGVDPRSLGLFAGTPLTEASLLTATPTPPTIHIYVRNIERLCETEDDFFAELRTTVLHESAHYFGLDEEALEAIGLD